MESPLKIWTPERQQTALESLHKWRGVPHMNRVAIPGIGIDCIHLIAEVYADADIIERRDFGGYDTDAGLHSISHRLKNGIKTALHAVEVDKDKPEFGDILIFKTGTRSGHCAFYENGNIWHSLAGRCVTKSDYNIWKKEIDVLLRLTDEGYRQHPVTVL